VADVLRYPDDIDSAGETEVKSTRVLVVDDESMVRQGLCKLLEVWGYRTRATDDGVAALEVLRGERIDIVIADIRMPGMDGLSLLREIQQIAPDVDVVMITAYDRDFTYMDVVESGAADFVVKPFESDELRAKITRLVKQREIRQKLIQQSIRDGLTHLYNRRHFAERLDEEVKRSRRQGHPLSMLILDVDGLKRLNDRRGHQEGDAVLVGVANVLAGSLREGVDLPFRIGGDEFAALIVEANLDSATQIAERVLGAWSRIQVEECSLSIGVTELGADDGATDLIERADRAMYRAKRAGGSRVFCLRHDDL
jgi:diguanylate cyclase (GGDEF)-like protein